MKTYIHQRLEYIYTCDLCQLSFGFNFELHDVFKSDAHIIDLKTLEKDKAYYEELAYTSIQQKQAVHSQYSKI